MASLSNGTYWIVPAANTALRLDVHGGSAKDGADVQVYTANVGNAQIYSVRDSKVGGKEIVSRYSGKAVDVAGGQLVDGSNVQQYKRNGTRAQAWEIVDSGSTVTVNGTSYAAYNVKPYAAQTLAMQAGATSGSSVKIRTAGTGTDQRWAFVPVPAYVDGGVYTVRSMLDPKMCLDVSGGSMENGANIQLYTDNGTDAQKFAIYNEGDGYSLRSMQSDKFVDVAGGKATTSGTNVQQYVDNDTRAQRWAVTTYGTQTYDGEECSVVEFGAGNANTCLMDVSGAKTTNSSNIQIYTANHSNAQKWLLQLTDTQDPKLPAPTDIRFASSGSATESVLDGESVSLDVAWTSPSSWASSGAAHFEHRVRQRLMAPNGTWQQWGEWSGWQVSLVSQDGAVSTLEDEFSHTADIDTALAAQWQIDARSVTTVAGSTYPANVHGGYESQLLTLYVEPSVTFSDATWSPFGLEIPYQSDWDASSLTLLTASEWHDSHMHSGSQDGTIIVPYDKLVGIPDDGTQMVMAYRVGTSTVGLFPEREATVQITLKSDDVTATLSEDGPVETVTVGGEGQKRAWLGVGGRLIELEGDVGTFDVPYPMSGAYSVYVACGDKVSPIAVQPKDSHMAAWSLDGESMYAMLVVRDSLTRDIEQDSEQRALDSRPELSVDFSPTRTTGIAISVRLYGLEGEMTRVQMNGLAGRHVTFRAPDGSVDEVAVTSISETNRGAGVWDYAVSMTKETR